jgi:hypothetical protein
MNEVTLTLPLADVDKVLQALAKMPIETHADLFFRIRSDVMQQQQKAMPVPTPDQQNAPA